MKPPLNTRVAEFHGAPTLVINGRPDSGLMLYHNAVSRGHDEIADFAKAGIHLLTTGVGGVGCVREDGSLDTSRIDEQMRLILDANPDALVLPRFGLAPPRWWAQRNPDHMMVHFDPFLNETVKAEWEMPSPSSAKWRDEMGTAMQRVIRYCEERYGGHILGYHLCSGDCGEWSYAWRHYTQSDYSPVQGAAYRAWLGQRYGDAAALARAWNRPVDSFDSVEIPRDWRHPAGEPFLLDPQRNRELIDYLAFHSDVVADAILHFARLAKAELRELGREKVVAVFYGYHFPPPGQSTAFCNSGHHALARVLESPDVDVFCAPYSYYERQAGGTYFSQLVAGSVRLHGKLFYSEEDTVTHVNPPIPYRYHCPDLFASENVLLRNTLGALRDGGTSWYMDWHGTNWYRDDALMASIAATQRLAQERIANDNRSAAQIAVFVSERTAQHIWHDSSLLDAWAIKQIPELWRIGAPIDVFLLSDLPRLLELPDAGQYRFVVFLDVPAMNAAERQAGRRLAAEDGRTILWTYAPGIIDGDRFSAEAVSALTGIRVRLADSAPLQVETSYTGEALVYGMEAPVAPMLIGDDPAAEVLGRLRQGNAPGLLRRKSGGCTAIWSAAPLLPAALLRAFARDAGVHVYSDRGDQVFAERGLLVLHASSAGERRIRLPRTCTVADAFSGTIVSRAANELSVTVRLGETKVWRLIEEDHRRR